MIVRGNGVPVKAVGLMGGGALTVVVGRKDRGIEKIEDLKGKKISVLSFQDTTYFALLGALASKNITKNDVNAQAVGPAAVASLVVAGTVDACACTPDWEIDVQARREGHGLAAHEGLFPVDVAGDPRPPTR